MWNEPTPDELGAMPHLRETELTPLEQKVVHIHFFIGGCDWYGVEYDPNNRLFFGYAILNDDLSNAVWGYFSYDELRDVRVHGIEIDRELNWTPCAARQIPKIRRAMRWSLEADDPQARTYPVAASDWYATQVGRTIQVRQKGTNRLLDRITPLAEWGDDWAWNVTPDGKSVYVHRIGFTGRAN